MSSDVDKVLSVISKTISIIPIVKVNAAQGLSQLRKSLSAAEQDVIRRQEEMETLRQQLATPTIEVETSGNWYGFFFLSIYGTFVYLCPKQLSDRLISLLKIQVGALSKFVHSRTGDIKLVHLRNLTDALICTVAHLDASCQPINLNAISDALDQVLTAYQKDFVNITRQSVCDPVRSDSTIENEIQEIKIAHKKEIESLRHQYERQVKILRERIEYEEMRRKKAVEDLQTLNAMNDHSLTALKRTQEEILAEQRQNFEEQIAMLKEEHSAELNEEKEATRLALDAVQRSHEVEVKNMAEKLRNLGAALATYQASTSTEQPKCLENSQLDEKMALLLADKENHSLLSDMEVQNHGLHQELRKKDSIIDELRQRIQVLENQIAELNKNYEKEKTKGIFSLGLLKFIGLSKEG
ncbi:unnamed protein product [Dracunculus medinensis]|uniref:FIP-RBD domain-containing protein n=1 Tax=Dracunculus medinensis TaxID=318479 RepID=A0A158Q5H3_DRAME|nr:unnamed protein product [Dracunculus medinensis]